MASYITTLKDDSKTNDLLPRTVLKAIADENGNYLANNLTADDLNKANRMAVWSQVAEYKQTSNIATQQYQVGEYFLLNDDLVRCTQYIGSGDTIAINTNVVRVSVAEELIALNKFTKTQFTYVITNQNEFETWVNNTAGNDYTSVGILGNGNTYTTDTTLNLDTLGTKRLIGIGNERPVINSIAQYGIQGNNTEEEIRDIKINTTRSNGSAVAFYKCSNLINCTGIGISENSYGRGFYNCTTLIDCIGTGDGTSGSSSFGFSNCSNLTNCIGYNCYKYAFYFCNYLINCEGIDERTLSANQLYTISFFYSCNYLTNCRVNKTISSIEILHNSIITGFSTCNSLVNCSATISSVNGACIGFNNCTYISNCHAACKNTNSSTEDEDAIGFYQSYSITDCSSTVSGNKAAYGFRLCHRISHCGIKILNAGQYSWFTRMCYSVSYCYKISGSINGDYSESYSSPSANSTYACANTLNGGWNVSD